MPHDVEALSAPVLGLPGEPERPLEDGIALCLSGGGYRAMLFHLGSLWRLCQLGLFCNGTAVTPMTPLGAFKRLSSVSGGSITAATLGLNWSQVARERPADAEAAYVRQVVVPIRALARVSLAEKSVTGVFSMLRNIVLPGSVNDHVVRAYAKHLFGTAVLTALPDSPRFVINASNLQSGALVRFSRPYVADWRVGMMTRTDKVSIAQAVAASSAFPPFLAPADFFFSLSDYKANSGGPEGDNLLRPPFATKLRLADGGVYDNLGLETVYKRFKTLLVSNAGAPFAFEPDVPRNWIGLGGRVISVMDNQVLSLRKRLLIGALKRKERLGAFWDIEQDIAVHHCADALRCDAAATRRLAEMPTDLAAKDDSAQERLINWGYAACDAAVRAHFSPSLPPATGFPYPRAGVG